MWDVFKNLTSVLSLSLWEPCFVSVAPRLVLSLRLHVAAALEHSSLSNIEEVMAASLCVTGGEHGAPPCQVPATAVAAACGNVPGSASFLSATLD